MIAGRWQRLKELHQEALELPASERDPYLRDACGPDAELLREVQELLALEETDQGQFLNPPAEGALAGLGADSSTDLPRRLGKFSLHEELGRGGLGVVFRARQEGLEREVALKVLTHSHFVSEEHVRRFHREARNLALLDHPGIVRVYDVGEDAGVWWIAMDHVDGRDLAAELSLSREGGERKILPAFGETDYFGRTAHLVRDVALALQHAHDSGVVHRDVKPHNVLLRWDGQPCLVDFGLSKSQELGSLTPTGEIQGTPYYMSPEQARVVGAQPVDHRTDVYSLGVVLYELLTHERPFEGTTSLEVLRNIQVREAPEVRRRNPEVPRDLALICMRAMAKEPRDRYASAVAFAEDLGRFLKHQAVLAQPVSWRRRLGRALRRRRAPLLMGLGGLLLAAGAWWMADNRAQAHRIEEQAQRLQPLLGEFVPGGLATVDLRGLTFAVEEMHALEGRTERVRSAELALAREFVEAERRARVALAAARVTEIEAEAEDHWAAARAQVGRMSALDPEAPETGELQEATRAPQLSVLALGADGESAAARVSIAAFDVRSGLPGAFEELGEAPLNGVEVAPGFHRLLIEFDAGGWREFFVRVSAAPGETVLEARLRADEDALLEDMVLVEGDTYTLDDGDDYISPNRGRSVAVESFWVDRYEVSNADWRAYCSAVGKPLPEWWSADQLEFPEDFDRLPVVDMTWEEARRYAEWAGKRLWTHPEFVLVARGAEGRRVPYAAEPGEAQLLGNTQEPVSDPNASRMQRYQDYLNRARPVDSNPEAATAGELGVHHLLGNVLEWTESVVVERGEDGSWLEQTHMRWVTSGSWHAQVSGEDLREHRLAGVPPAWASSERGFRCAKSARP